LKTNELSLSRAVVRLCNRQRSNISADWAKNPDKPPIFENPPRRQDEGPKRGRVPEKPGRIVTLVFHNVEVPKFVGPCSAEQSKHS